MFEKSIIGKYSPEEVRELAQKCSSIKELARMLGYSQNAGSARIVITKYCDYYGISLEHFTGLAKDMIKRAPDNVFIENSSASQATLRRWYEKGNYSEYKCSICGQEPIWNGRPLSLTLDHINGNNKDDRLENLRWVCPNCDRQLDTFCSKNIKTQKAKNYCTQCGKEISMGAILCPECYGLSLRKVERPTADELQQILYENRGNFSKVGAIFSVSDNTIRKWCKSYNLPFHSADYKYTPVV